MRSFLGLLSVVALATSAIAADAASTGKLMGEVRDSSGVVIANAAVIVHFDMDGSRQGANPRPDFFLTSDKMGRFSAELIPGFYDIAVFAHAFSPVAQKVRIKFGQTAKCDEKLVVDPKVIAEFGDRF